MCIIPGCTKKKYSEPGGVTHPYCGRRHAELGKKMNIQGELSLLKTDILALLEHCARVNSLFLERAVNMLSQYLIWDMSQLVVLELKVITIYA